LGCDDPFTCKKENFLSNVILKSKEKEKPGHKVRKPSGIPVNSWHFTLTPGKLN